ncbi:hypothetical protein KFE25_008524 [Diacronema lutheri]|uniref:Uncharacterized protein n=1 Tax=Diacronema lutheri TaxID=2081491 RepID=A0A8J5XL32_DIALT|nr:hypothetical protein KFE25_008524 [Diacronema lutheri]
MVAWVPPLLTAGRWLLLLLANPNLLLIFQKLGVRVENKTLYFDVKLLSRETLMAKPPALRLPEPPRGRAPPPAPLDYGKLLRPIATGGLLAGGAAAALRNREALPRLLGAGQRRKLRAAKPAPALRAPPGDAEAPELVAAAPTIAAAMRQGLRVTPAPPIATGPPSISSRPRRAPRAVPRAGLRSTLTSARATYGYLSLLALSAGLMKPAWEHVHAPDASPSADAALSSWPLICGALAVGHCADRFGHAAVLRALAGASAATLLAAGCSMQLSVAKLARAAESYAMLALPVVQAAVAEGTARLLDRSALFGLLTAAMALCMVGGSAASVALLQYAGIGGDGAEPAAAGSEAALAATAVVRVVVLGAALMSAGALACTALLRAPDGGMAGTGRQPAAATAAAAAASASSGGASGPATADDDDGEHADAHNYRLTTPSSALPPLPSSQLPTWLFRAHAAAPAGGARRGHSRISPSTLAAAMLIATTISNPGTFFEVWDGVYNWHRLGGEPLDELARAALLLVGVQAGLLRPLARLAGGSHRLLSAAHVGMAITFMLLMRVEGGSTLSYPLFALFLAAHSLVDSLTATLVSAYAPVGKQGLLLGLNHAAHLVMLPPPMSTTIMPFVNAIVPILLFPPALRQIRSTVSELAAAIADT